ncbi:MAG: hypothetical protein ACP5RP_01410 [Candidatus Micrarchaeia archaeon]
MIWMLAFIKSISYLFAIEAANFATARITLLPLVGIAITLDAAIVGIWYMIGVLLNNNKVKQSAIGEAFQYVNTIFIVVIVLVSISLFSSMYNSVAESTLLLRPSAISSMCSNIVSSSGLTMFSKDPAFSSLCSYANLGPKSSFTQQIDYGLVASTIIMANVTNQTATNLNSFYVFDAFIGFLMKLSPFSGVCGPGLCLPMVPNPAEIIVTVTWTPYIYLKLAYSSTKPLMVIMNTSFEISFAEWILVLIFLYIWPYLLFGGFVLRSFTFTRKIGGLFIATVLGILFIYPAILSIEYATLSNSTTNTTLNPYGISTLTPIPVDSKTDYTLNFFVEPRFDKIAEYYGCWPVGGNLIGAEALDIGYLLVPFASAASSVAGLIGQFIPSVPNFYLPSGCDSKSIPKLVFATANAYGIIGVDTYFIPIINFLITISSILGLSGLIGGDTDLAGLGKLI